MTSRASAQKFVDAALALFAARGYYGVSLADVATDLGLTKQSVIYHFRTKEMLYRSVLEGLAARLSALSEALPEGEDPRARLQAFAGLLYAHLCAHPQDAQLVARELLDNFPRSRGGRKWYLKGFLDRAVELLADLPGWEARPEAERMAAIYQMIGAIHYFSVSTPTLEALWGAERVALMREAYLPVLGCGLLAL